MMLFDDYNRVDMEPGFENEDTYNFLNRSASAAVGRVRSLLEGWLSEYPEEHRPDMLGRLKASFEPAFYELCLYTYLRALGGEVTCHPQIRGSSRRPDFQVSFSSGEQVIIEAVTLAGFTHNGSKSQIEHRYIYDEINKVRSQSFLIGVDHLTVLTKRSPPVRGLRAFLKKQLAAYDPDLVEGELRRGTRSVLHYADDGIDATFTLYPKRSEYRDEPAGRLIGVYPVTTQWGDCEDTVARAIRGKATYYGALDQPFVVAVNALCSWNVTGRPMLEMLLGPVGESCAVPGLGSAQNGEGVWVRRGKPEHTRVSAVMLSVLYPWDLSRPKLCLYHNPWARRPCDSVAWLIPECVSDGKAMVYRGGKTIAEVLGLPMPWPGQLFE